LLAFSTATTNLTGNASAKYDACHVKLLILISCKGGVLEFEAKNTFGRISKAEKEIEDLEKQIADIDTKLSNPEEYEKASKEPGFFDKYNLLKKKTTLKCRNGKKPAMI
jgi:hypothetical protein